MAAVRWRRQRIAIFASRKSLARFGPPLMSAIRSQFLGSCSPVVRFIESPPQGGRKPDNSGLPNPDLATQFNPCGCCIGCPVLSYGLGWADASTAYGPINASWM
jgi:hypothetical protein